MSCCTPTVVSKCTVYPDKKSTLGDLKLCISDMLMLCIQYMQKGCLFSSTTNTTDLIPHLTSSLSRTLSIFPPLAGRLTTRPDGHVYITCNDAGVDFIHASTTQLSISDLLSPRDIPSHIFDNLFPFNYKINHTAHSSPIMAVQVTELADGIFIGCAVSHAVVDGASFWHFFNTFAAISRGASTDSIVVPDFRREHSLMSDAVLRLTDEDIKVTFSVNEPLRERVFSFSSEAIQKLKAKANGYNNSQQKTVQNSVGEISSFQSLCALVWRAVTRARNLPETKSTTFRMAANVKQRVEPKLGEFYFGNAIHCISTCALSGHVVGRELSWCAEELNKSVRMYDSGAVRRVVEEWEREPKCFPLGNHDGATVHIGSSPRFPMYSCDFGWGRPVAVRRGGANKFDGKLWASPGKDGGGAVDLEVALTPDTMARLENDIEFMMYVSP